MTGCVRDIKTLDCLQGVLQHKQVGQFFELFTDSGGFRVPHVERIQCIPAGKFQPLSTMAAGMGLDADFAASAFAEYLLK
jgi:hypothetical protein